MGGMRESLSEQDEPVKYAPIKIVAASASTVYTIVTGVAGRAIRVLAVAMVCGPTARAVSFQSGTSGATREITGTMALAPNDGPVMPYNRAGWMQCSSSQALVLLADGTSAIGGIVTYQEAIP